MPELRARRRCHRDVSRIYLSPPDVAGPTREPLLAAARLGLGRARSGPTSTPSRPSWPSASAWPTPWPCPRHRGAAPRPAAGVGVGPGDDVLVLDVHLRRHRQPGRLPAAPDPCSSTATPATWNLSPELLAEELDERRARRPAARRPSWSSTSTASAPTTTRSLPLCARAGVPRRRGRRRGARRHLSRPAGRLASAARACSRSTATRSSPPSGGRHARHRRRRRSPPAAATWPPRPASRRRTTSTPRSASTTGSPTCWPPSAGASSPTSTERIARRREIRTALPAELSPTSTASASCPSADYGTSNALAHLHHHRPDAPAPRPSRCAGPPGGRRHRDPAARGSPCTSSRCSPARPARLDGTVGPPLRHRPVPALGQQPDRGGPGAWWWRCRRSILVRARRGGPPGRSRREGERVQKVVIVGQGYVGLPVAMRASRSASTSSASTSTSSRVKRLAAGESYVEDVSRRAAARPPSPPAATGPRPTRPTIAGFDVAVISVPTPLARRRARPRLHRGRGPAMLAPHLTPGRTRDPRVDDLPGHHRGAASAPILEEGSGLVAGADFHLGYSPERIDPGNADWTLREHAEGRVGHRRRPRWPRSQALLRPPRRHAPCRCRRPKEAELTKLLENTFRHVNIALVNELAMFAHDLGIDVWEAIDAAVDQAVRLHALHARARRRRPLPADRPVLPVVAGAALARPDLPLRRARQRRQRAHARLRRAPPGRRPQPSQPGGAGPADPAARPGVQEEHRRRPRVALAGGHRPQLLALGAEVRAADPHVDDGQVPDWRRAGSTPPPTSSPPPTLRCCSSTTTPSTST